jgi:hypothetical protein
MTQPPRQNRWSPTFRSIPETLLPGPRQAASPKPPTTGAPPPTQYEFIMQTGDESTATTKKKLKTVRSHVMKNYLQQQQQQGRQLKGSDSLSSAAGTDRRKGKQRARSSRSGSQDTESSTSPTISEGMRARSSSIEFGHMGFDIPPPAPFPGGGYVARADLGRSHPQSLTN